VFTETSFVMNSQVKWGLALIIIGLLISPFGFPFLLVYSIPLILIGVGLILFQKREERIEEVRREGEP
jgi:uncharacterized membrane protein